MRAQSTPSNNLTSFLSSQAIIATLVLALAPSSAFCQVAEPPAAAQIDSGAEKTPTSEAKWRPLTGKWEEAHFGGDGEVTREEWMKKSENHSEKLPVQGKLFRLGMGDPLTGIRWTGELPQENYELRLQARRTDGFDFFAAITFPVGEEHCSLVLGGWGGGVVGISSIDGNDASSNETTSYKDFKNGQWYRIRIRVGKDQLLAWIDEKEWVVVERSQHTFDIRIEMDPCLPMGVANFQCESEIRGVEIRSLDDDSRAEDKSSSSEESTSATPAGNP